MKYRLNLLLSYIAWWTRKPPAIGSRFLSGYGRVNTWGSSAKKLLRQDICRCAAEGVKIYHIELAGWAGSSVFTNPKLLAQIDERYAFALRLCRAFGMWLMPGVLNGNQGKRKYGDTSPTIANGWDTALRLLDLVIKHGRKNVLAQPVGETQDEGGRRFESLAVSRFRQARFLTVNNNDSRPSGPAGMDYFAWHPFKIADIARAPQGALIVSDTGEMVREVGDGLNGPGKPAQLRRFKQACIERGCRAAIYYAFLHAKHDRKAIEAMGRP